MNIQVSQNHEYINNSGVEDETEESRPFDPKKISIEKKPVTLDQCLRRLEQKTINLAPDFQRKEVWTIEKKSRLIESLLLKIPIPMFYVASDENGRFTIVDGLQRLSTIRDFVLGEEYLSDPIKNISQKGSGFKLKKLEFLGDSLEKKQFKDIGIDLQNRLYETEFTFTIINPGTPEEVKRNIFKRINTGGAPLTSQEIRHALYTGRSTKLLKKFSESAFYKEATLESINDDRMGAREVILRFLSFYIRDYTFYPVSNDMDEFMSETMQVINSYPNIDEKRLRFYTEKKNSFSAVKLDQLNVLLEKFELAMKRAKELFEDHAFRRSFKIKNKTPINKSLFESWTVFLSQMDEIVYADIIKNRENCFDKLYSELLKELKFQESLSRDSWKNYGVTLRYKKLEECLNQSAPNTGFKLYNKGTESAQ